MREIKFRVWDKIIGAWMSELCVYITTDCHSENNDYVVMQYTGLKDKNGKEIYEGDIVLIPWHYCGDNEVEKYLAVINYDAPEFITEPYYTEPWDYTEVIGNIYETPELLKRCRQVGD